MRNPALRDVYVLDAYPFHPGLLALLGAPFRTRRLHDWAELLETAPHAPASAVFVVDPYAGAPRGLSPRLGELLRAFPSATVVAVMNLQPESTAEVRALLEMGVSEVIGTGVEDTPEAVAHRLRAAHARRFKRRLEEHFSRRLSGAGHTLLLAMAEAAADGGGVEELARVLRASPRTVAARCRREGLPNPRRLLAWARLLLAGLLLDEAARPVASVALACGYTTDAALRRTLREFLGKSPTALRREGAFEAAARAFGRELREGRAGVA